MGKDAAIRCTTDEVGEAIGRISRGAAGAGGGEFEGYTQRRRYRAENSARCVRSWRCLVPHRRFDAHGLRRFLSISSIGSATLFAGRAKTWRHRKLQQRLWNFPASARLRSTASRFPEPKAPPEWRRSSPIERWISRSCAGISHGGCRPMPARCSCGCRTRSRRRRRSSTRRSSSRAKASIVTVVRDKMYFDDPQRQAYVPLDAALRERVMAGKIRL